MEIIRRGTGLDAHRSSNVSGEPTRRAGSHSASKPYGLARLAGGTPDRRQLTRREFLKLSALSSVGLALAACAPGSGAAFGPEATKAPTKTAAPAAPTGESTKIAASATHASPTAAPKPTAEAIKASEKLLIKPPLITTELLFKLYDNSASITNVPKQDETTKEITLTPQPTSKEPINTISLLWNQPISSHDLTTDPVKTVKATLAVPELEGIKGERTMPVKESPQTDWITMARFQIAESERITLPDSHPPGLILDKGTYLTVFGYSKIPNVEEPVLIIAFDRFLDPRNPTLALASIAMTQKNINLLKKSGVVFVNKNGITSLQLPDSTGKNVTTPIGEVEQGLASKLLQDSGAAYIHHFINPPNQTEVLNPFPVVPHVNKALIPEGTTLSSFKISEDGKTIEALDQQNKPILIAQYNAKKADYPLDENVKAWKWRKYEWYDSKDIEIRRKGVEIWAGEDSLTFEGYSETDKTELKTALIKYLPYVHTSPLTVFPWYSNFPYDFPENPLAYLKSVRIISNWDGKITANEPKILAVRLNRKIMEGKTNEPQVEWVASVMKEAMFNAISTSAKIAVQLEKEKNSRRETPLAIFLSNFYTNNFSRHDIGTVSAEIVTRKDLIDSQLLKNPTNTIIFNNVRIAEMNAEAKKQGWTADTSWM